MPSYRVTVRQMIEFQSRQYGIYLNNVLVEGGFFSRRAAEDTARAYREV
jgi:hypothetical protein